MIFNDMIKQDVNNLSRELDFAVEHVTSFRANGNLLQKSPLIATVKHGRLKYVLNSDYVDSDIKASKAMETKLEDVLGIATYLMTRKDECDKHDLLSIYESVGKAQQKAMEYNFWQHAEEFTKLLYKHYEVNAEAALNQIISGYGKRQILYGVDCNKDVDRIMRDVEKKEYGIMPYIKNRSNFDSIKRRFYDNAEIYLLEPIEKWYGTKNVKTKATMKMHEVAIKEQKELIKSVATM